MKDLPIFDELAAEKRLGILGLAAKRELSTGHSLFREGEEKKALYLITKGKIKLWKSFLGGERVTIWIAGSGDILGEDSLFTDKTHHKAATVIEDAFVCTCYKSEFELLVKNNPELAVKIIKSLGQKLAQSETWQGLLAGHDKKGQLGELLLRLASKFGSSNEKGTVIDLNVTHQDLADFLGASRVTITKSLSKLPGVKTNKGNIYLDKKSLEEFLQN